MALAGLDIGSGGCKCTIYDHCGHVSSYSFAEYGFVSTEPGNYELDLNTVWSKVLQVCSEAVINHHGDPVLAIGISSFGEAGVLIDHKGQPLSNCIMYSDQRGAEQCQRFIDKLGKDTIVDKTALKPHPMFSVSKILWLKENQPDLFRQSASFLLVADYIIFRFTGKKYTDYSLASRTMLFNVWERKWDPDLLEAAGLKESYFATPVASGSPIGKVRPEVAKDLGLPASTIIVIAGHDQITAAIGSGVVSPGQAVNGMGSVDCITPVFDQTTLSKAMSSCGYATIPYLLDRQYVTYAFNFTGGSLIRWYRDTMCQYEKTLAEKQGGSVFSLLEAQMPKEPTDLLVLPHFQGAATPYMDLKSLGAIIGLTVNSSKGEIYRALMEGVAYEALINLTYLEHFGIKINSLTACGGGSRSNIWLQIKADVLDIPIAVHEHEETGTLGSAILAGVASGVYQDVFDGVKQTVRISKTVRPISNNVMIYKEKFKKYNKLYQTLKNINEG